MPAFPVVTDGAVERKARGAFFTPQAICDFITRWAVRAPADRVLEPSCGEAAFLLSAGRRLRELRASGDTSGQLCGLGDDWDWCSRRSC